MCVRETEAEFGIEKAAEEYLSTVAAPVSKYCVFVGVCVVHCTVSVHFVSHEVLPFTNFLLVPLNNFRL